MIPRTPLELDASLPLDHAGWTPAGDDLSEEGFGFFRDIWLIHGVTIAAACDMILVETLLADVAEAMSEDAGAFDHVAQLLAYGDEEELREHLEEATFSDIQKHLGVGSPLDGLELGVAGLVYALSAVGCWPAASCRGHPQPHAWADHPVVFLAADSERAETLAPLVKTAKCGFGTHPDRSGLLTIEAESIEDLMALAQLVVDEHEKFTPEREPVGCKNPIG